MRERGVESNIKNKLSFFMFAHKFIVENKNNRPVNFLINKYFLNIIFAF